jgi:hypothetical protein
VHHGCMAQTTLRLISGAPPKPLGKPLFLRDVPDDLTLRAAAAPQRETLLVGLALSYLDARTDGLLAALRRVASEANALALTQVLEVMARRGSLGFVVEALELEWLLALGKSRGVAVSDVLATSDTVSRRGLTTSESRRIVENFAHTLDPDTVRFCFTTGVQTMGAGAMAVGNTIHIDPTDPRWQVKRGTTLPEDPEDDAWDSFNGVLLAHEPSHVWSYQHQGSQYAVNSLVAQVDALKTGDRGGAYLYQPDRAHFLEYGEEQRAMIVQDYVTAFRGRAKGETTSLTLYGGTKPTDDVLKTLSKYVEQMRAMGPGVPQPVDRQPEWILCACITRGVVQDGLAGALGAQGSVLIASVGRASTQAVTQGLARHDAGQVALSVAGATAAVAASLLPREQSSYGGASGGSAILDQAGIPRGVVLEKDGVSVSAKAKWDAPVRLGEVQDPRDRSGARRRRCERGGGDGGRRSPDVGFGACRARRELARSRGRSDGAAWACGRSSLGARRVGDRPRLGVTRWRDECAQRRGADRQRRCARRHEERRGLDDGPALASRRCAARARGSRGRSLRSAAARSLARRGREAGA